VTKIISPDQTTPISVVKDQEGILGPAEDATLTGGAGNDILSGGNGRDRYHYGAVDLDGSLAGR